SARDARPVRRRRMQLHLVDGLAQRWVTAGTLESRVRLVENHGTTDDERRKVNWNVRVSAVQVDDAIAVPRSDAALRTEDHDSHAGTPSSRSAFCPLTAARSAAERPPTASS